MGIDLEKHKQAIEYGTGLLKTMSGKNDTPLQEYPDNSDESAMQYLFESLDDEALYNKYLHEELQEVIDSWLLEDITATDARKSIVEILTNYYGVS